MSSPLAPPAPPQASVSAAPPSAARDAARLYFLDLLRIAAFVTVLVGHKYQFDLLDLVNGPGVPGWQRVLASAVVPFTQGGSFGVMLFFLVSGYIITQVLQHERPLAFAIKRAMRIYPLYLVACWTEMAVQAASGTLETLGWPVRLAQWLLIGDFVGAPSTLGYVDWTLRIELVFYLVMGVLGALGVLRKPWLTLALYLVITAGCLAAPPLPTHADWSRGFVNIFFPMLLIGSTVRLAQDAPPSLRLGAALTAALMLAAAQVNLGVWQPRLADRPFMALALLVFGAAWLARAHIRLHQPWRWLAELTYAVYLFHNWLWEPLAQAARSLTTQPLLANLLILAGLLLVCHVAMVCVEKPGVALGPGSGRRRSRQGLRRPRRRRSGPARDLPPDVAAGASSQPVAQRHGSLEGAPL